MTKRRELRLPAWRSGGMAFVAGLLLSAGLAVASQAAAAAVGIFGYDETPKEGLDAFPKWTGVLERYFEEKGATSGSCQSKTFNRCHYDAWMGFLDSIRGELTPRTLKAVNDYMNKSRYIVDPINWGITDYWATPGQFFDKYGDCEDYAIAKYLSLRALGWDPKTMRIVVVQDMNLRVPHAILAVYLDGKAMLLDNQIAILVDASKIRHYRPIFSLSEDSWWRHSPRKK